MTTRTTTGSEPLPDIESENYSIDDFIFLICEGYRSRPLLSRSSWGSAVAAAAFDWMLDGTDHGETHRESVIAARTRAVIEGAVWATFLRVTAELGIAPDDDRYDAASRALYRGRERAQPWMPDPDNDHETDVDMLARRISRLLRPTDRDACDCGKCRHCRVVGTQTAGGEETP